MSDLSMSLSQSQRQQQILSTQMLQKMALLTLPITELQQHIQKEIEENPALEIPDEGIDDVRFTNDVPSTTSSTTSDSSSDPETSNTDDYDGEYYESYSPSYSDYDEEAGDRKSAFIENSSRDDTTLVSYLMQQLGTSYADPQLFDTASIIITSLDSNGFFTKTPEELVEDPGQKKRIEEAVSLIQSFDPPGVCVPNYQESLILQAKRRGILSEDLKAFSTLIREHLSELKPGKLAQIATQMNLAEEDILSYFDFLKTLNPYPGSEFASGENSYVVPEFAIRNIDDKLVLTMSRANLPDLELAPDFCTLADGLKGESAKETTRFINESVTRAKLLISQVELRYNTLYKTALVLMDLQRDFFINGPGSLKPLTLKDVAEKVGVHETTISRISQAKWIETDWGLFQMKQLFSQGVKSTSENQEEVSRNVVKQKIESIIRANTSTKKLSDQKIADMLLEGGIKVARRTVAKYRAELNLDSSFER